MEEEEPQTNATKPTNMDLSSLKIQRSTMKRNITKLKTIVEKDGASSDYTIIKSRLQMLESYFIELSYIQIQIEPLDATDESRPDLEEIFVQAKAYMVDLLSKNRRSSDIDLTLLSTKNSPFSHQNRLPQLKLAVFNGKYSEYPRFISTFNTLVHEEPCIPTINKFNYLLNCLSGPALNVIEAFQINEENYQKALDRLKDRNDNKTLIFNDNINSMFAISPMSKPNATALRLIIDNVAALRSSLLSSGTEMDVMNAIIIHIVLSKVDSTSKSVYDEKPNLSKLPSWDEFFTIICRRYQFLESRTAENESFQQKYTSIQTTWLNTYASEHFLRILSKLKNISSVIAHVVE